VALDTGVRITEARPEHAPFIAWVILTAFRSHLERGFWDHLLGGAGDDLLRYLETLTEWPDEHLVHRSLFLIAEVDGEPAAALSGYFEEEHGGARFAQAVAGAAVKAGMVISPEAGERAMTILNVVPEHPPRAWIVESVATLPQFRRRGLIDALMAEILERGRQRGAEIADISVFIGNDAAQRAYEKCGFTVVQEKRDAGFESVYSTPGIRTLRRALL
jgi:ribosomal protein S18 acetylase RimI-like enzyme